MVVTEAKEAITNITTFTHQSPCGECVRLWIVCVVIVVAPQATYVGPGEIESKLEAINLTLAVPSDLARSRI